MSIKHWKKMIAACLIVTLLAVSAFAADKPEEPTVDANGNVESVVTQADAEVPVDSAGPNGAAGEAGSVAPDTEAPLNADQPADPSFAETEQATPQTGDTQNETLISTREDAPDQADASRGHAGAGIWIVVILIALAACAGSFFLVRGKKKGNTDQTSGA